MLFPALFWVAGIYCARLLGAGAIFWLVQAALFLLVAIVLPKLRIGLVLLLFFSFGGLRFAGVQEQDSPLMSILNTKKEVQQTVRFRVDAFLAENVYQVHLDAIAGHPVSEKLLLYSDAALMEGTGYESLATVQKIMPDPVLDIYPNRFAGLIRPVLPPEIVHEANADFSLRQARSWIQKRLDAALGPYSATAKALLLSDAGFKRENRDLLSRAGITHLIVVSGLHVAMLSMILMVILRFFVPLRIAEFIFVLFLFFFAALNNWAPPILRAILMICLLIFSRWLSRPLGAAQSLSVALFIITLVNPGELFSLGLQLSFVSVALIVFALPKLPESTKDGIIKRSLKALAGFLLVSIIVGLGISPLTLYYFGQASLNGILGNLLGLPLITLLLGLSILILFFPLRIFILSFQGLTDLWQAWLKLCARLPLFINSEWISPAQGIALGIVVFCIILIIKGKLRLFRKLVLPLMAVALILHFLPENRKSEVYFFNAGVADCSLILTEDGRSVMIDTGGMPGSRAESMMSIAEESESWLAKKLLVWLGRNRIRDLDYLVITHLHSDHAGGLKSILDYAPPKHLIISGSDLKSDLWQELAKGLKLHNTKIVEVRDTMSITLGESSLKILHPSLAYRDPDPNNLSIVLRYDSPGPSFLFTADIENEAEAWLVQNFPEELKTDILKVAHHGSRGSSSPEFLDLVKPVEAVIPVTARNVYGFPHPETLQKFHERAIPLRYTHEGTIRYSTK